MFKKAWQMKLLLNIWPPFLFTGIRVVDVADDFRRAKVRLKLSIFNDRSLFYAIDNVTIGQGLCGLG